MKLTKLILILCLSTTVIYAQTPFWGAGSGSTDAVGQFDGGLNGWISMGILSSVADSSSNANWVHKANSKADDGSFWGTRDGVASPSTANGAAVFDSDYLDNAGGAFANGQLDVAAFGTGASPASVPGTTQIIGHRGELISPAIDCSGQNKVFLTFYQYYRNLQGSTYVGVSSDGGNNWTDIEINRDIPSGLERNDGNVIFLDISDYAANQTDVHVRFAFEGGYYFWIVDDVALYSDIEENLSIVEAHYPPAAYAQPQCHIASNEMGFACLVLNQGTATQNNIEVTLNISTGGAPVHNQTMTIPSVASGDTATVVFADTWVPGLLDLGAYEVSYSADNPGDFTNTDNVNTKPFFVTEDFYAMDPGASTALRPSLANNYDVGNIYSTGADCQERYHIRSVSFQAANTQGRNVEIYVVEVDQNLVDTDYAALTTQDYKTGMVPGLNIIGYAESALPGNNHWPNPISVDNILDYTNQEDTVCLDNGATYMIMASYAGNNNPVFHGVSVFTEDYYPETNSVIYANTQNGDFWFLGGYGPETSIALRLELGLGAANCQPISIDEQSLAAGSVLVYPNPTNSLINVEMKFNQPNSATVTLADMTGRVIHYQNYNKVENQIYTYDTKNLPAGTYIARVASEEGFSTQLFVVE